MLTIVYESIIEYGIKIKSILKRKPQIQLQKVDFILSNGCLKLPNKHEITKLNILYTLFVKRNVFVAELRSWKK